MRIDRTEPFRWDSEKRLVRVQSRPETPQASWRRVEWQYNALGRRIRQITADGSAGAWVAAEDLKVLSDPVLFGRHIAELNATDNALVRSYVWGLGLSGTMDGAGAVGGLLWVTLDTASGAAAGTHFCAYDGNGHIVALTAASDGSETARYEYGPFGTSIHVTGPAAALNPFRFSTKRTVSTTELALYEYRAYSPILCRWLSRDPIGNYSFVANYTVGKDEETINQLSSSASSPAYVLALNDPVNLNDPNGLQEAQWPEEALIKALDIGIDGTRKKNNKKKLDDAVAHCGAHSMRLSLLVLRSVSCSY